MSCTHDGPHKPGEYVRHLEQSYECAACGAKKGQPCMTMPKGGVKARPTQPHASRVDQHRISHAPDPVVQGIVKKMYGDPEFAAFEASMIRAILPERVRELPGRLQRKLDDMVIMFRLNDGDDPANTQLFVTYRDWVRTELAKQWATADVVAALVEQFRG